MPDARQYAVFGPLLSGAETRAFLGCEVVDDSPRRDLPVVVVWLPEDVTSDAKQVARLQRETSFVTQLRHPNIIRVYGLECFEEGWARIVGFADGEPLSRLLERARAEFRPIDPRLAARMIVDVCEGVHHAHEEGQSRYAGRPIVHGGVRPDTLIVTFSGRTMVTGYAASVLAPTQQGAPRADKLVYSAPEQIIGGRSTASPASDVYAIGAVLYELIAGHAPYAGASDVERAVLTGDPPLVEATGLAGRLGNIAATAMAKRGADRFDTVDVMREAILQALADDGAELPDHTDAAEFANALIPPSSPERTGRRELLESADDPDAVTVLSRPAGAPEGVDADLFEASRPGPVSGHHEPLQPTPRAPLPREAETVVEAPRSASPVPVGMDDEEPTQAGVVASDPSAPLDPEAFGDPSGLPAFPDSGATDWDAQVAPSPAVVSSTARAVLDAAESLSSPNAPDRAPTSTGGELPQAATSDLEVPQAAAPQPEGVPGAHFPQGAGAPGLHVPGAQIAASQGAAHPDPANYPQGGSQVPQVAPSQVPSAAPVPNAGAIPNAGALSNAGAQQPNAGAQHPNAGAFPNAGAQHPNAANAQPPHAGAQHPNAHAQLANAQGSPYPHAAAQQPPPGALQPSGTVPPGAIAAGVVAPGGPRPGDVPPVYSTSTPQHLIATADVPRPTAGVAGSFMGRGANGASQLPHPPPAATPRAPIREDSSITAFSQRAGDGSRSLLFIIIAALAAVLIFIFAFPKEPPKGIGEEPERHKLPKELVRAAIENAGKAAPEEPDEPDDPEDDPEAAQTPPELGPDGQPIAPPAKPRTGSIELESDPRVYVFLDNESLGRTPLTATLPVGRHRLRFTDRKTGINVYRRYRIRPGGEHRDRLTFGTSSLVVNAPDGASILLNGKKVGTAPMEPITIYEGQYLLRVRHDEASWSERFDAPPGRKIEYNVRLGN